MRLPNSHDALEAIFTQKKSNSIWVVLMKDDRGKLTLLVDHALHRPWSCENRKLAEFQAKNCNGEARLWKDAWDLLMKEYPNLEKSLVEKLHHDQAVNGINNLNKVYDRG